MAKRKTKPKNRSKSKGKRNQPVRPVFEEATVATLKFKPPDTNAPGYLRRQRRILSIQAVLNNEDATSTQKLAAFDDMIEMFLIFIVEPKDKDEARNLLLDLSEDEHDQMLAVLKGGSDSEDPPDEK